MYHFDIAGGVAALENWHEDTKDERVREYITKIMTTFYQPQKEEVYETYDLGMQF